MTSSRRSTAGQRATRSLLVEHASELIEEVGLARFTAREVARRVGVSHAAPFRHFPSRSALLTDVAASGYRNLRGRMLAASGQRTDPHTVVVRRCAEYVAFAQDRRAIFALMFRDDLLSWADDLILEQRLAAFNLIVDVATGGDARTPTARETSLLAGVHGYAVLSSQGLLGPLSPEHFHLTLGRNLLVLLEEQHV